jgi:hypothetical protein
MIPPCVRPLIARCKLRLYPSRRNLHYPASNQQINLAADTIRAKVQFAEKQWESIFERPKKQETRQRSGGRSKMADEPVSRILFGALLCSSAPRRSFL